MKHYDQDTLIAAQHFNEACRKRREQEQALKLFKKEFTRQFNQQLRRYGITWLRLR